MAEFYKKAFDFVEVGAELGQLGGCVVVHVLDDLGEALLHLAVAAGALLNREPATGYHLSPWPVAKVLLVSERQAGQVVHGIASARRTGNLHAQSEMEAMLAELG